MPHLRDFKSLNQGSRSHMGDWDSHKIGLSKCLAWATRSFLGRDPTWSKYNLRGSTSLLRYLSPLRQIPQTLYCLKHFTLYKNTRALVTMYWYICKTPIKGGGISNFPSRETPIFRRPLGTTLPWVLLTHTECSLLAQLWEIWEKTYLSQREVMVKSLTHIFLWNTDSKVYHWLSGISSFPRKP